MAEKKSRSETGEKKSKNNKRPAKSDKASKGIEISKDEDVLNEDEISEDLEGLPPELKTFMMSMRRYSGPIPNPFASKLNANHIDKIIEASAKDDERRYKNMQQARKFHLVYFLAGISLFVFLTLFLVGKDSELFKEIVKLFIVFAGGFGAGYGIKSYISQE